MWTFYRHSKKVNRFLHSNNSVSRTTYFRILAIASIDILFTLPLGLVSLASFSNKLVQSGPLPFYSGWEETHRDWQPSVSPYGERLSAGTFAVFDDYWTEWTPIVLAYIIFSLFGLTREARNLYWRLTCATLGRARQMLLLARMQSDVDKGSKATAFGVKHTQDQLLEPRSMKE